MPLPSTAYQTGIAGAAAFPPCPLPAAGRFTAAGVAFFGAADFPAAHRLFVAAMIRARPGDQAALLPGGLRRRWRRRRCNFSFPRSRPAFPLRGGHPPARGGAHDTLGPFVARERDRPFEALRPRDQRPDGPGTDPRGNPGFVRLSEALSGGLLDALPPGGGGFLTVSLGCWRDRQGDAFHAETAKRPDREQEKHQRVDQSQRGGIQYGLAVNAGQAQPVTDDAGLAKWVESLNGLPVFVGMQAEGRERLQMFSRSAMAQCDYVFSDSMTWTDNHGKRMRKWIAVEIGTIANP